MSKITVGVLTVSDRCYRNEATDESGPCLIKMLGEGVVKNGVVLKTALVPDCKEDIQKVLMNWCEEGINLILTTGGTGIAERDVTPEATAEVVEKTIPGIPSLLFKQSSDVTPFAALSRGIAGVRGKTLIINLPGSKKASRECLNTVACIIPHAVDLLIGETNSTELVHTALGAEKSSAVAYNPIARRRQSAYPCISVSQAQKIITERVFLLKKEKVVNYKEANGYVLAQEVSARFHLPPFDASLKDGYAVLSSDQTFERDLIGVSSAGDALLDVEVLPGCCVRVNTGAAIPPGADAVVQVEDTELASVSSNHKEEKKIILKKLPFKGQEIRPSGSDFKIGQLLMTSGTYLDPSAVGLLVAASVTSVRVFDKPLVAVLSTGDEIASPDEELSPRKVRDSNRITLINLLSEENFGTVDLGISPDNPSALRNSLERGFRTADVVVTTGSMSMGERDYMKEILETDFNAEICFGRVLMKPGKPTSFAIVMYEGKPKLWFGLPGNPASAFVTSHLFLLPALRKISGFDKIFPLGIRAKVNRNFLLEDRPQYVRGVLTYNEGTNSWFASVQENQSSSYIGSCVNANCLIEFPKAFEPKENSKPPENCYMSSKPTGYKPWVCPSMSSNHNPSKTAPADAKDNIFSQVVDVKALMIGKSYFIN